MILKSLNWSCTGLLEEDKKQVKKIVMEINRVTKRDPEEYAIKDGGMK